MALGVEIHGKVKDLGVDTKKLDKAVVEVFAIAGKHQLSPMEFGMVISRSQLEFFKMTGAIPIHPTVKDKIRNMTIVGEIDA